MEKLEETAKFCCEGEKRNGIVGFAEHIPCVLYSHPSVPAGIGSGTPHWGYQNPLVLKSFI